jgi:hypothetical protein
MSKTPQRVAAQVAATGLLLSALPAAAAGGTTTPPTTDPCITYTVTLAGCQKPVHSCEVAAFEKAKTDPDATCNTLVKNAAESQAANMPQRTVLVPTMTRPDGSSVAPESVSKTVAFQKDDPNTRSMSGLNSFYLGQVHRAQTYIPADSAYSDWLANNRKATRDGWNANGYVLGSCSEYVFEKYYDYSVFEDAIVGHGNDYRTIFNIAYAQARFGGLVPASAIGTRALTDPIQRGKDGVAFNPPITFPQDQPKNGYFTVPLPMEGSKVKIVKGQEDTVITLPDGSVVINLKSLQRPGLDLTGVTFVDANMAPTITAGATYYDESWAWHKNMSATFSRTLDEQLYAHEAQQADFAALLHKREELAATIAGMFNPKPPPSATPIKYYDGYWRDPLWNPDPTRVSEFAEVGNVVVQPVAPTTASTSLVVGDTITTMPTTSTIDTSGVRSLCGSNPVICLLYRLEALDAAIEAELQKAKSRGCLDTSAPTACDWSPKRFAQRVMKLYQGDREKAFKKCNEYTDSFADLKSLAMSAGAVSYAATDYTTSPTQLELFFTRRDKYLTALRGTLGDLIDPVTRNARVKWEAGDSYSLGDDTFGATATYNIAFELTGLGTTDCAATPKASGSFEATGRALGMSKQLIKATASIEPKQAAIQVDIFGNSVFSENPTLPAGEFNVVSGSKMWSKQFIDVETTFVVVVVPVTLGAGVGGTVGINYGMGTKHVTATDANGMCKVNGIGVGGQLMPFASVDGELYAGVDLLVVSAGVKGKLQLVHASLPLTADAAMAFHAAQNKVMLDMGARADLKFTFMSGSIAAYVEVGVCPFCTDFEQTLVSWDGLHYDLNLFNRSVSVPLGDVQYLVKHPL